MEQKEKRRVVRSGKGVEKHKKVAGKKLPKAKEEKLAKEGVKRRKEREESEKLVDRKKKSQK